MTEAAHAPVQERRERYQTVLSIVEHNTGDPQPPTIAEHTIVQLATGFGFYDDDQSGHPPDAVRSTIRAAVQNNDLLQFCGRYVLVDDLQDEAAVLEAIRNEAERDGPCRNLIRWGNQALQHLRGDPE